MKRKTFTAAVLGVTVALGVGQLTAQPPQTPDQPPAAAAPRLVHTAKQQGFLGDLNAAVRQNNDIKVARLLADAAGDAELSNVVVEKLWNLQDRADEQDQRIADTMEKTFAIQQRQRQIMLQEQILAELKKDPR